MPADARSTAWPELNDAGWEESSRTLHMWTQLVGKVRLALEPMMNHWWQVPLYVTSRGLTTSLMRSGERFFEIELDLLRHQVRLHATDGAGESFPLPQQSTLAAFHGRLFDAMHRLGVEVMIHPQAVEIPETILLDRDEAPRRYDPDWGSRFFTALVRVDRLLKDFRARFAGKASPVHFFWGSFDHAVTRFSGRGAPKHPGGVPNCPDYVMHEAYAAEVSSAGFWPGIPGGAGAAFYSYGFPEPEGLSNAEIHPKQAGWDPHLKEFILPWKAVRASPTPEDDVRAFLQSTYEAVAELSDWNREEFERPMPTRYVVENPHELRM